MVIDNVLDRYRLPRTVEEDSDRSSGAVVDNFHNRYRQPRNVEEDSDRSRGAEIIPQIRMMDYDSLPLLCPLLHSLTRAFETISIHIIFDSIGYFWKMTIAMVDDHCRRPSFFDFGFLNAGRPLRIFLCGVKSTNTNVVCYFVYAGMCVPTRLSPSKKLIVQRVGRRPTY